ncbi:RNA polymerase II transcription factor B subunit, partial [Entamoeba invadens IP1]
MEESKAMICGILLDATYFTTHVDKISQYVQTISAFVKVFKEIHDMSFVFLQIFAGKTVYVDTKDHLFENIANGVKQVLTEKFDAKRPNLSAAMSSAMCRINSYSKSNPTLHKKIVAISTPLNAAPTFITVMNNIFAAQKIGVSIDTIVISDNEEPCTICQQASYLTNGIYNMSSLDTLLPRLLVCWFG